MSSSNIEVEANISIWSDRWWIEEKNIWFIDSNYETLFCMDKETFFVQPVSKLPGEMVFSFRRHPRCIKKKNVIFCMPNKGNNIYSYHILNNRWKKIELENTNDIRPEMLDFDTFSDKIYVISNGLKKIIELNIETEQIEHYYKFPIDDNETINKSIFVNQYIYTISSSLSCIFEFNCINKSMITYSIEVTDDCLDTICFDGEKFWLGGQCKKIYIWIKDKNEIKIINNFPEKFGIYDFKNEKKQLLDCNIVKYSEHIFYDIIYAGGHIWFIPSKANKILYCDRDSYELKEFEIEDEVESRSSLQAHRILDHKYLVEYIYEDRYIGLYSLKNRWVIEIDALKKTYKILKYHVNHMSLFLTIIKAKLPIHREKTASNGIKIYQSILEMEK